MLPTSDGVKDTNKAVVISISSMRAVHGRNVNLTLVYEPVLRFILAQEQRAEMHTYVSDHNPGERPQKHGVSAHKTQQTFRAMIDI